MPYLFSYGTLQEEEVQMGLFGRPLKGRIDKLKGFRREAVRLGESASHSADERYWIAVPGGAADAIDGVVLEMTEADITVADTYEPSEYQRIETALDSGRTAWVYVAREL